MLRDFFERYLLGRCHEQVLIEAKIVINPTHTSHFVSKAGNPLVPATFRHSPWNLSTRRMSGLAAPRTSLKGVGSVQVCSVYVQGAIQLSLL